MRSIISALLLTISSSWALAQSAAPFELAPDAPDRHIVVKGDTLWGISARFLKDPYRWPEIWRLNDEQVRNPHLIYPGQVVILDRNGLGGNPQLRLGRMYKAEPRIYSTSELDAIPAIPQNVIEPFLSQPLVIEDGALSGGPRVVATEEGRVNVGQSTKIYASGIESPVQPLWNVYRPGTVFKDPDTDEVLGYEAVYLGDARVTREPKGEEATTLDVVKAKLEIGRGDYLKEAEKPELLNYAPHAPRAQINGKIISIYGGVGEAGKFSIVTISRGKRDGIEHGHVLAISRTGESVTNNFDDGKQTTRLPDERYGLLFIFRVFERVSYGLVMEAARPVLPRDTVLTP
ncbi:MAG: LysM peptidoglycan-binding domain-containing protein [Gammaproteobacteria bacterium]|nr:LysM peptidoglycan-binding domain-containing protein [Gammaproteobacteria bacterium]MBU1416102.1 LysM peptidoglycan-binding domain-containing protein [Gammaproteobacteria bacterium]